MTIGGPTETLLGFGTSAADSSYFNMVLGICMKEAIPCHLRISALYIDNLTVSDFRPILDSFS